MTLTVQIKALSAELTKATQPSKNDGISTSRCVELLRSLDGVTKAEKITIAILNETKIGLCLNKLLKTFRRYKRSSTDESEKEELAVCIDMCQGMLNYWKEAVKEERSNHGNGSSSSSSSSSSSDNKTSISAKATKEGSSADTGLPGSVSDYRHRLVGQKKEMYKDPPVLPPQSIAIEADYCPLPKRSSNGELSFVLSNHQIESSNQISSSKLLQFIKDFKPNRTPEEVLRAGSFGGTYFRPIVSSVTNKRYNATSVLKDTVEAEWITNLKHRTMLTSSTYNASINKYKVKCGGSLGMWESSGWIADSDPYGWFQWYCRFYRGRRSADDERQISRWLKSAGPRGRFRSQLCNKILAQGKNGCGTEKLNDFTISPVIRQTLLHWGLEITESVLIKHAKRVGKL